MRAAAWFGRGVAAGMAAWGLGHLLSGSFEPFDSGNGFMVTQAILGTVAVVAARRAGGVALGAALAGGYLGLNLYPYLFGSGETRAWWMLGALTSLSLIMIPAVCGVMALLVRRYRNKAAP